MWIPDDPEKRPELWKAFADDLKSTNIAILVHEGEVFERTHAEIDPSVVLGAFRGSALCRIGSSRGNAIPPHAAFRVEGDVAVLTELIGFTDDFDRLRSSLESLAVSVFFDNPNIARIHVPRGLISTEFTEIKRVAVAC